MQSGALDMHDDLLQSSNKTRVVDSVVMPAVTAQAPAFSRPPMHNPTVESNDPQKDDVNTQSPMHAQYVLQLLQLQRQAGFLCDITIHVKDRSFKAHKSLLAACSLYFRSLFADPNTKESTALNLVPLPPAGFEVLLDYIYTGNLAITAENCSAVLSAATCLQMTNVVETCKKFMQSTFQMSNCKESVLVNSNNDKVLLDHSTYLKKNKIGIHQEEYLPSLSRNSFDSRSLLQNQAVNVEALQRLASSASAIPSASQLQSVLPILMTNQPRQPTPQEVQNILASIPNATDFIAKYPMFSSAIKNMSLNPIISQKKLEVKIEMASLMASLPSTKQQKLAQSLLLFRWQQNWQRKYPLILPNCSFTQFRLTEDNVSTSSVYLPTKPSTSIHTVQNGDLTKSSSTRSSRSSVQDQATRCTAAHGKKAAEQGYKNDRLLTQKEHTFTLQTTSEDASNSIEISSDEEGSERGAWSTDRSAQLSSDLSGTPCTAAAQVRSTDLFSVQKNPVVKTLSLPTLSENPPIKPLSRARSTEDNGTLCRFSDDNFRESVSNGQEHMKESAIVDEVSHMEYADRRGVGLPEDHASDTLSPLNERYNDADLSPNSVDESMDDSVALDLSVTNTLDMNKHLKMADTALALSLMSKRSESDSHAKNSSRRSSATSSLSDPGMQMAIDALEMLKQGKVKESGLLTDGQNASVSSDSNSAADLPDTHKEGSGWDDDNVGMFNVASVSAAAKQATYSRKPRRTTDGQMCTWPGCKQVFRHRNIYEEHMKMHKRGAPAAQLRKCYMGARVKKTVREQLEELRSDVFEGETEASKLNRTRKRKSNAETQEPLRKRVNVKDRVGHLQFSSVSPARPSMSRKPLHQVIHSLSKSPTAQDPPPAFLRPPALIPSYAANPKLLQDIRSEGMLRLAQGGGDAVTSSVISQSPGLALVGPPYSLARNAQRSPTDAASAYGRIALSNAQMQGVSPIKATLALLGIQTPLPATESAMTSPAITATSPVEHFRRHPSTTDAVKPLAETLFQPTAAGSSFEPSSGEGNGAAADDFSGKDASRMASDASSVSSGSPPAWANNTNPSVKLNR